MQRNYKISAHPYCYAARCATRTAQRVIKGVWWNFLYPVLLISCGVSVGVQFARMFGSVIGTIWR